MTPFGPIEEAMEIQQQPVPTKNYLWIAVAIVIVGGLFALAYYKKEDKKKKGT
jgi:hypothetical protein